MYKFCIVIDAHFRVYTTLTRYLTNMPIVTVFKRNKFEMFYSSLIIYIVYFRKRNKAVKICIRIYEKVTYRFCREVSEVFFPLSATQMTA